MFVLVLIGGFSLCDMLDSIEVPTKEVGRRVGSESCGGRV
jgi:hypothetical protein